MKLNRLLKKRTIWSGCMVAAITAGCAAPVPRVTIEEDAARAIGLAEGSAIEYRTEAGPLDLAAIGTEELTLPSAVRMAAEADTGIQAALSRVRVALAEAKQTRLLPNPVLSLTFRFPETGGDPTIEAGVAAELLSLLTRPGQINASDSRLRGASAQALTVVLDVAATTQETYVAIQASEATLIVLRERRALLDRLLNLTNDRIRLGEGTRLDLLTLQAQRMELEAEIADQELNLRDQRLALARLIGRPSSDAAWRVSAWNTLSAPPSSESTWIRLALTHRPEAQAQSWELEALGIERSLARWALWEGSEIGIEAEREGDWSVGPGVALPIPLFDMGQARSDRASALLSEARHNLLGVQREIVEEVRRAFASYSASVQNLRRVRDELIPLQQARLEQAESQYRAGQTDITALFLAEQELRATRSRLIELEQRALVARIKLERAAGGAGVAREVAATMPTTANGAMNSTTK